MRTQESAQIQHKISLGIILIPRSRISSRANQFYFDLEGVEMVGFDSKR
jgi:hypothetical protein